MEREHVSAPCLDDDGNGFVLGHLTLRLSVKAVWAAQAWTVSATRAWGMPNAGASLSAIASVSLRRPRSTSLRWEGEQPIRLAIKVMSRSGRRGCRRPRGEVCWSLRRLIQ